MRKIAAVLALFAGSAFAHQDRILPIGADGTLGVIPDTYGPIKVRIFRATDNPRTLTGVALTSPNFNITLSQCILSKLKDVTHVQASGSWYHDRGSLPAYASLTFYSGKYDPQSPANEYYSVTFSLLDGHILMGERAWDPFVGGRRATVIDPADKCSDWQRLGVWPNNSFKPSPHQGGA